ncbi:MAG: tRNA pseudouridine(38-40) synthase TruA [Bacteroidota bacterium]
MKYFIHLAYKGTAYQGWQRQANGLGVQEVLEKQLAKMFKQKVGLHACGRTDAGVHASQFFCHTIIEKNWNFDAVFRINKMLPSDIKVLEFIPVVNQANAQLDVIARTYDYYIHLHESPFLSELSTYYLIEKSTLGEMQQAASLIKNYNDFRSFCKQPDLYPTTICQITKSELSINAAQTQLRFRITGNRFLKAMVRMLVGNLVKIGQGKLTLADFIEMLENPRLTTVPSFAYPQGLYLSKVVYPYLERANAQHLCSFSDSF